MTYFKILRAYLKSIQEEHSDRMLKYLKDTEKSYHELKAEVERLRAKYEA